MTAEVEGVSSSIDIVEIRCENCLSTIVKLSEEDFD